MTASRTPEHDVARRIDLTVELDEEIVEVHMHVGADLRTQSNEEAGRWIKAIIDRVVRKELGT